MPDHAKNRLFFKIQEIETLPSRGRKKEVEIKISFYEHIPDTEAGFKHVLTIPAGDFLAITYNTIIFIAIPAIVSQKNFIDFSSYEDNYKMFSQRLITSLHDTEWDTPDSRKWFAAAHPDLVFTPQNLYQAVQKNNAEIYADTIYHYSPKYQFTAHQNINELQYICNLCLTTFFSGEIPNAPQWFTDIIRDYSPLSSESKFDSYTRFYHQTFHSRPANVSTILFHDELDSLGRLGCTTSLADIVYFCTVYLDQYHQNACGICQNCGKAFVPKTKHKTAFCSDQCRQNFHQYVSNTASVRIYQHIEEIIKANINKYCQKGSPNYLAGKQTLQQWQKYAKEKREHFDETICVYAAEYGSDDTYIKIATSLYENNLLTAFRSIAEENNFKVKIWPRRRFIQ